MSGRKRPACFFGKARERASASTTGFVDRATFRWLDRGQTGRLRPGTPMLAVRIRLARSAWFLAALTTAVLTLFGGVALSRPASPALQQALGDAIAKGDIRAVERLLQSGADPN